jgi:hypothetical protein
MKWWIAYTMTILMRVFKELIPDWHSIPKVKLKWMARTELHT